MNLPTIVKILVPILNMIQQIPQLIKVIETKQVRDLSFATLIILLLTSILWSMHGYFIGDISLLIASLFTSIVNSLLFIFYIKYNGF